MADLGHRPRRPTYEDGTVGDPIKYSAAWWGPGTIHLGPETPPAVGHICTACGCFYVPVDGAVCPNQVMEMLKERVL